jgi:hypothetical protein
MADPIRFDKLDFDAFRKLATQPDLSYHEKVGFPVSYREHKEDLIFADMCGKLTTLDGRGRTVLEIGPGCSQLPVMLADLCAARGHELTLVDSAEMLALLPDAPHVRKVPGRYPDLPALLEQHAGKADLIIAYSVVQYVFAEGNIWDFLDRSLLLLRPGGELFLGDIPNVTMRKRFFASEAGHACHRAFSGTDAAPEVHFNRPEPGNMDDSVVLALLARARAAGFHAWVLPQHPDLPMGNRREDLLIRRP